MRKWCAGPTYFGSPPQQPLMRPPHVLTLTHCARTAVVNVTITNPAYWGVQHFFSNSTLMSHVTILAKRGRRPYDRAATARQPVSLTRASREARQRRVGTRADARTPGTGPGERTNASKGPLAHTERGQPAGVAQPIRRGVNPVVEGCRGEPVSAR